MSWCSPANLLSAAARERCAARLRHLPVLVPEGPAPRPAAVLLPLCVVESGAGAGAGGVVSLLYTRRAARLSSHAGQNSFPGGMADPGEAPVDTALRETEEELGLARGRVEVWGQGSAVPGRDNRVTITPVVGFIRDFDYSELRPNADEVDTVFTVPIKELCNPENHGFTKFDNYNVTLPVFLYMDYKIWGLTALITHMFLTCLVPKEHYRNDLAKNKIDLDELRRLSKL